VAEFRKGGVVYSIREIVHGIIWAKRNFLNEYQVKEIEVIGKYLRKDDVCIDVGAHAGSWSIPLSKIVNNGMVWGFEALPYYARVLGLTIRILGRHNIRVVNKAILSAEQEVSIQWKDAAGERLTGKTHVAFDGEGLVDPVTVQGTSLDSFLAKNNAEEKRIAFIKIDIEGAELFALKGAAAIINKWHPIFYLEIYEEYCKSYGYSYVDIFELMSGYGYQAYIVSQDSKIVPVTATTYSKQGDVLFIHGETRRVD
jgi:FkbM family methyltransferase